MRQGLGAGVLAAVMAAIVSCAAGASPHMTGLSPAGSISPQTSLLHRVVIYAKDGSRRLIDGRWNLGQSESKLGIKLSSEETKQLMACTGKIVCEERGGEVFASAASVLRPDLLVTAKHVFSNGRNRAVSFEWCSFRSYSRGNVAVPIVVDKDQRKGYLLNNEDFIVVRLKRALADCNSFAINDADSSLSEGDQILSVTSDQRHTLNRLSSREPVVAKGLIRSASKGFLGGPPFYYTDIDFDEGGSGGAVFALRDGRPVSDDEGRLVLRGISVAFGPHAKNGRPYSDEQNYTIVIGLQADFRDLVEGKARGLVGWEPALCLQDENAEIDVISDSVSATGPGTLSRLLPQQACTPNSKTGKANANCIAKGLNVLEKNLEKLAASPRAKQRHEFRLRNDTSCPICFTYDRCNAYGCWDEFVRASGKSILFAGVRREAPVIKNPQFCKSGRLLAEVGLPLPPRKPEQKPVIAANSLAVDSQAVFLGAKEKAQREGVWALTSEDIRGLSLQQIEELRGY